MSPTPEEEAVALLQIRHDLEAHARSLTEIVQDQRSVHQILAGMDRREVARTKDEEHLEERLDRIEHRIDGIYKLGWWILGAFGSAAAALVANFLFRGGFQ